MLANVPIAVTLNGRDTVPDSHPLCVGVVGTYSRASANQVVAEADLVLFAGSQAGSMTTNFWRLPGADADVLHIDIDAESIGRNYERAFGVVGDARCCFEALTDVFDTTTAGSRAAWISRAQKLRLQYDESTLDIRRSAAVPIRPERFCDALTRTLPDNGIIVVDTGHAGMWMSSFLI